MLILNSKQLVLDQNLYILLFIVNTTIGDINERKY